MSDWMELVDPGAPGPPGATGPAGPPGPTGPPGGLQWFNVLDSSFAGGATRAPTPPPFWEIPTGFTADSTAAFAAADAAAHAVGGGVLYAPRGFYIADVLLSPGVWLVGDGWGATVIHARPAKASGGIVATIPVETVAGMPLTSVSGGYFGGCLNLAIRGNLTNPGGAAVAGTNMGTRPDGHYGNGGTGSFGALYEGDDNGEDGLSITATSSNTGTSYAFLTRGVVIIGCKRDGFRVQGVGECEAMQMWIAANGRYGVMAGGNDGSYLDLVSGSNGIAAFILPSGNTPDLVGSIDNQFVHCSGTDSERADWIISGLINRIVACEAQNSPIGYELIGGDPASTPSTGASGVCRGNVIKASTALGNKEPLVIDGSQSVPGGVTHADHDIEITAYPANSSWALASLVTIKDDAPGPGIRLRLKGGRLDTTSTHTDHQTGDNTGMATGFSAVAFGKSRDGFHQGSIASARRMDIAFGGVEGDQFFNPAPGVLNLDVFDGFSEIHLPLSSSISITNPVHHGAILPGRKVKFIFVQDGTGGHTVTWDSAFLSNAQPRADANSVTTVEMVNVSTSLAPIWAVSSYLQSYSTTPTPIDPSTLSGLIQWNKTPITGATDGAALPAGTWPAETGHGVNLTAPTGSNPPFFHSSGPHLINGHGAVRFVTSDTGEITTALVGAVSPVNQPITAIIVARIDGTYTTTPGSGYDTILDSPDSSAPVPAVPPNRLFISGSRIAPTSGPTADPQVSNWGMDTGNNLESAVPSDLFAHIFEASVDASVGRLTIDGGAVLAGITGAGKWTGVQLGLHGVGQYEVSVLVGEVLVFNRLLTVTEINGVRAYLANKFSIPVVFPGTYVQAGP